MTGSAINIPPSRKNSDNNTEGPVLKRGPSLLTAFKDSFRHLPTHHHDDLGRASWMSALATTSVGLGPTSTVAIPTARSVASTTKVRMFTTNWQHRAAIDEWKVHLRGRNIFELVILDVEYWYQAWFLLTVVAACISGWVTMYSIGFVARGDYDIPVLTGINIVMLIVFSMDMIVSLFVSKEVDGTRITDPWEIKRIYFRCQFWVDLFGTVPFDAIVLAMIGEPANTLLGGYIGMLGLLNLLRLYRMFRFFHYVETSVVVNHVTSTLVRNSVYVFFSIHWAACLFYFIGRQQKFNDKSWVGMSSSFFEGQSSLEKYWVAVYWSSCTLTTVGYGDLHAYTPPEVIFCVFYQVLNLGLGAYFIGTITLLVTTHDTKSQQFRDSVAGLKNYTAGISVEAVVLDDVHPYIDTQRKLDFGNHKVIHNLPGTIRRRLLRSVYKEVLEKCYVLKGPPPTDLLPQPFFDSLLALAHVEVFLPMVHIIERGEVVHELYIIVNGSVEVQGSEPALAVQGFKWRRESFRKVDDANMLHEGMPLGEISFFSQSPSLLAFKAGIDGCRVLTLTREKFMKLCKEHPQATQVLRDNAREQQEVSVQHGLDRSTANCMDRSVHRGDSSVAGMPSRSAHASNGTPDFILGAAQGQLDTVREMLEEGQDVNATDYGRHTALIMAATNGHKDVVTFLLEHGADVAARSSFGTTALTAAVQEMHPEVVDILVAHGARLDFSDPEIACTLCQVVRQEKPALLACYLKAGANANVQDYDNRTALHVAAGQGNLFMVKQLLLAGARSDVEDRWGLSPLDEAVQQGFHSVVAHLQSLQKDSRDRSQDQE